MKNKARILSVMLIMTMLIGGCGKTADTKDAEKEAAATTVVAEEKATETVEEKETVVEPTEVVEKVETIIHTAINDKNPPKPIHFVTKKKDGKRDNSGRLIGDDLTMYEDTYYVCINAYPSFDGPTQYTFKIFIYHLFGENYENAGQCDKYVIVSDNDIYDDICWDYKVLMDELTQDSTTFESYTTGIDYDYELTADNMDEVYNIISNSNIVNNMGVVDTIVGMLNRTVDNVNISVETVVAADGSSSYYPYASGSSWSKSIDSWLEEYLYIVAQCFDENIQYD